MEMTEIRRAQVGDVENENSILAGLAESAKSILGYSVLAQVQAKATLETTKLQTTLRDLEISVLNSQDVLRYQKERLVEQTVANVKTWLKEIGETDRIRQWNTFTGPSWGRTIISEYREAIPEFVLAKAIQVKTAYPECELWVESLATHPDPFLIAAMPVKQYHELEEHYYIEVWAEPKFEGKLGISPDDIPF